MTEPLWTRENSYFVIEARVGKAWVEQGRAKVESAARAAVDKLLRDPSVSAVRVHEHEVTHRCSELYKEESNEVMRLPPKMQPLHQTGPCPRCHKKAQLATDGTNNWLFCTHCETALPS